MQNKMRRFKQLLPDSESKEILRSASNGILSLVDPDGYPYGVPLSFAYDGADSIYFHSARNGRKIECLKSDARCSFCIINQDMIVPEEFTSYFRSVIVSGRIKRVDNEDEIIRGLKLLCEKYSSGIDPTAEINKCLNSVCVLKLEISEITGKEAIELHRQRELDKG